MAMQWVTDLVTGWRRLPAMTNPFLHPRDQAAQAAQAAGQRPPKPPLSRDALQVARTQAMAEVTQIHAETAEETVPVETLVAAAHQAKTAMDDAAEEYARVRDELWKAVGGKAGKIGKTTAKFSAPSTTGRRSVNYDRLHDEFPDAYDAVVEVKTPDPNAPGRLYL